MIRELDGRINVSYAILGPQRSFTCLPGRFHLLLFEKRERQWKGEVWSYYAAVNVMLVFAVILISVVETEGAVVSARISHCLLSRPHRRAVK